MTGNKPILIIEEVEKKNKLINDLVELIMFDIMERVYQDSLKTFEDHEGEELYVLDVVLRSGLEIGFNRIEELRKLSLPELEAELENTKKLLLEEKK
ncbi:MAG: hypothetical protein EOM67_14020 [Spirochaetia bacterium]|nr:hypothetical protein [Spirochaetia bacterium]